MSLFEYFKDSYFKDSDDIKAAVGDIILMFLDFVKYSIPLLFILFYIKLCLVIFW